MIRPLLIFTLLMMLGACGADGEPVTPVAHSSVTLSNAGVSVGTNLGLRRGPFSVNLGLGL